MGEISLGIQGTLNTMLSLKKSDSHKPLTHLHNSDDKHDCNGVFRDALGIIHDKMDGRKIYLPYFS